MNKIEEAIQEEINIRLEECDRVWADYAPEIKLLSDCFDSSKVKDINNFVSKIQSVEKVDRLKEEISNLKTSNAALIEEADYLRNQLRVDDKDFYDWRVGENQD